MADGDVDVVHEVVYRRLLPILVALGVVANLLCLAVLSRPTLRAARVNSYLLVLAASDLLVCAFHIPVITTVTGCVFSGYSEAFYFAHFGWTTVGVLQTFGTYTIVWLSLDRFMAVWFYDLYPRIQQRPHVIRNRLVPTGIACFAFHLVYMINAEAHCSSWDLGDKEDLNCDRGQWIGTSGYQLHYSQSWHTVFRVFFSLFIRWIPSALLLAFNAGLVIGVARGRVTVPSASHHHGHAERNLVTTTIAITVSFMLLTLPIVIYITGFAYTMKDRCTGRHPEEVLRAVGNCLQLLEHVIHIFFLAGLNRGFRRELKFFLRLEKSPRVGEEEKGEAEAAGVETGQYLQPRGANSTHLDRSVTPNMSTRNSTLHDT